MKKNFKKTAAMLALMLAITGSAMTGCGTSDESSGKSGKAKTSVSQSKDNKKRQNSEECS